jgi:hypothetical protein
VTIALNNAEIRVSGVNWTPGDRVTISLSQNPDGSGAVQMDRKNVGRNGRFRSDRIIPPFQNATIIYVVVAGRSGPPVITPIIYAQPTAAP